MGLLPADQLWGPVVMYIHGMRYPTPVANPQRLRIFIRLLVVAELCQPASGQRPNGIGSSRTADGAIIDGARQ